MSIQTRIADDQPEHFAFTEENLQQIRRILGRYPQGRQASAVIPLLDLAQRQHDNWLPMKAIEVVAEILEMAEIRVLEIATFYSMFNLKPVGRYFLQACTTTPCWLRGSDDMMRCIRDRLDIRSGETSSCGRFTLLEVECLGACVNAPILQVNDDYYEDLDYESTGKLLDLLAADTPPAAGSMASRRSSEPQSGPTSLSSVVALAAKPQKAGKSTRGKANAE